MISEKGKRKKVGGVDWEIIMIGEFGNRTRG